MALHTRLLGKKYYLLSNFMIFSVKFRILFAILGSFGMAIIYGFKVNLSVAIVAMVNQTALKAQYILEHTGTFYAQIVQISTK